jgi:pimeloyl-ACP methyl ester carboxylesterase
MRRRGSMHYFALFLTLALTSSNGLATPLTAPSTMQGQWAGVLTDGAGSLYVVLSFATTSTGSLVATIAYPKENERVLPVPSSYFEGTQLRLATSKDGKAILIDGIVEQDRITGTYRYGANQGALELWPLRQRPRADLLPYTGDFSDERGHDIIVSESLGVLYFLDLTSGRTGRLYPLSGNQFFGGPTRLIYVPVKVIARFSDVNSGYFETLRLAIDGFTSTLHRKLIGNLTDVSFQADSARIAGTLRRPPGPGPFPAVLLLAGSNAQPRSGYYSLEDFVADHFLRMGFIVLTFDKRGAGASTGPDTDNGIEFVAAAAFRFLKQRPDVDLNRIGIWGMSQGGMIAPKVALLEPGVCFIINVSGSVVDANAEEIERTASMLRVDGFSESDIAEAVAFQRLKFHYAETGHDWNEYIDAYERLKGRPWFPDPYVGPPASKASTAWKFWRESGAIRPFDYWRVYQGPVLLLYGQYDSIGDPSENVSLFIQAMKAARNKSYTVSVLPSADHSMYVSRTGSFKEERALTTLDLNAFSMLDAWLLGRQIIHRPTNLH